MSFKNLFFGRRPAAFTLLAALLIVATIISFVACNPKTMTSEEASRWIAAYTPAHIDQESRIRIELTDLMMSRIDTSRSAVKAFSFSPSVKGSARYSADRRYIDFIPSESLKQGRNYKCRVKVSELTAVDSLPDFAFDFYVDRREMRFEDVTVIVDPDDISMMSIRGRLEYNVAAGDSISADGSILLCDYPGAKVIMSPRAINQSRDFRITGIKRGETDRKLTLSVNHIGGFANVRYEAAVPGISGFSLLNAERVEAADPYIDLEFSAPLSSQQELDGLITIEKVTNPRIERSGTNVKVYYGRNGFPELRLHISELLKNADGRALDEEIERCFAQEVIPPAIEIPFQGNILPDNRNLRLPFRAVNLAAVDVEVVKIFPANIMSFLQTSHLNTTGGQRRYGRLIYHKTARLDGDKSLNLHQWQDFSIDLNDLFQKDRGAVYNIRFTFRKAYSLYNREKADDFEPVTEVTDEERKAWSNTETYSYLYRDAPDYDYNKYNWDEADDPSKDSYYMTEWDRMPEVNIVASDLGVIVKSAGDNDEELQAAVTNLVSALPAPGIALTAYNFQLQKIGSAITDANGFARVKTSDRAFLVTASDGVSTTYLKLQPGLRMSTSNFDVSGIKLTDGIKGFSYGDRGVWRPGDDIHLSLIIEDKQNRLPDNHPVIMELYNPDDRLYNRQTLAKGLNGFYVFSIPTEENIPTGLWKAKFKVGNQTFNHPVRIETIKPNRLKININSPAVISAGQTAPIGLTAHWLTGPVAKDMAASVDMTLYPDPKPFDNYKTYTFKNPLISFTSSERQLYSGRLDSLGTIMRGYTGGSDINSPGMMLANITAKVTEPGGDQSITTKTVPFSPFAFYVGIDLGEKEFETDKEISFPVIVVDRAGAKAKSRELDYKIYRLDWDWWWEGGPDDLSRYVKSSTADLITSGTVTAADGVTHIPFKVDYPAWGKYLIMVRDGEEGHATGGIVTVDWPEWRGRSGRESAGGSTELSFNLDKTLYEVGETANVFLPKCAGGRVLLSIESGSRVIHKMWVNLSADKETKFPLVIDREMAPNFYVTATLLRPHKSTDFNTPIRLFGIQSVKVVNSKSILHPQIDMPDELHPRQPFTVKISERDRKPMTYTLAIVDEGLLDITGFKTPRPWAAMNQKEALGINTWDMFDAVIGAFGANFRSIMSIGGDEAMRKAAGKEKRFNPAVKFLGPFTTGSGSQTHKITLPNYVGSVRVMVVAGQDGAYGHADKTVKVTSPLMLLSSLPRSLACCDTVTLPVNIFALDKGLKNVAVNIEVSGPLTIQGATSRTLNFKAGEEEQLTTFRLACDRLREGKGRIVLTASGNGHTTRDTTFIDVTNPLPEVIETAEKVVASGASALFTWAPRRSGRTSLQIASFPVPDFNGIALFMDSYPHLCSEQLSSKALFMLFGRRFLGPDERAKCEKELPRIIRMLQGRQIANGGFSYWPGQSAENDWVTSMAGLVLAEASRQGFRIDSDIYDKWQKYQEQQAHDYRYSTDTDLSQAFRLYSMAIAGKPVTSAMNRLRESKQLSQTAARALASAYAETGRKDVALKLIERAERTEASETCDMFGSVIRNQAIELEALSLCGLSAKALNVARKIAAGCSGATYVTQDIALVSIALSKLADEIGSGKLAVKVNQPGKTPLSISENASLRHLTLNPSAGRVEVTNLSDKGSLSLSLLTAYQPEADAAITPQAKGLKISISYADLSWKPVTVGRLKQDTEFKAKIIVTNLSDDVENMALTYAIPSGWEIWNSRLFDTRSRDYLNCDIRDNAILFYFDLKRGETKTYEIRLRAAYPGCYLLPPTICEDMYNPACRAITSSRRVTVIQ